MKLLVIISSHECNPKWCSNMQILNDYMKALNIDVEYCGISNKDDFSNYEPIITFKYKILNANRQFTKICDFISDKKAELDYDWYMKIRPDIKLLENINMEALSENAINARARVYNGPRSIRYGMSVNGPGKWGNIGQCKYAETEHDIILDDNLFIFHRNTIMAGAFEKIYPPLRVREVEWTQTKVFTDRNIPLHVIGINLENVKHNSFSGNVNMKRG